MTLVLFPEEREFLNDLRCQLIDDLEGWKSAWAKYQIAKADFKADHVRRGRALPDPRNSVATAEYVRMRAQRPDISYWYSDVNHFMHATQARSLAILALEADARIRQAAVPTAASSVVPHQERRE